ncbi:beta-ketoacyl synthase chain length factor [Candidatus Thalassolituus haligoni]|uniref:beta-ketoacyl synthase chain length factor n=1 Tax=Candidatus Thalassolituus haligoni TaxID=3100113 RepID=UPI003513084F
MSGINFSIRDWAVWMPAEAADEQPHRLDTLALGLIPAMMRRRLGEQGKLVVSVCSALVEHQPVMPMVFCSRHGEIRRSIELLSALIAGEPASPMAFSLSVHNAVSGMLSIATGNTSNISAIAAGPDSFVNALTEAAMMLADSGTDTVLCVVHDLPLPELYQGSCMDPPAPYAIAMLLEQPGAHSYRIDFTAGSGQTRPILAQLADVCALLSGKISCLPLASAAIECQQAQP